MFPAISKVYGELTKKKHGDSKREAIADLDCSNSPQGPSSGRDTHEAGGRMYDHFFVLLPYHRKVLSITANARVMPLAKVCHLAPKHEAFLVSTLVLSCVQL